MTESTNGRVVALHLNVGHREPMKSVDSVTAVAGEGIAGDRHRTDRPDRAGFQVLVIDEETLASVRVLPGDVKENVTTSGIDVAALAPGQRLELGDEVVLEISKPCAPCSRMEELRTGLQGELEDRRGMLASVVAGGSVSVGDAIKALSTVSS